MRKKSYLLLASLVAASFLGVTSNSEACTTLIVTSGASADGSVIVGHSDDNDLSDQAIVHVPAKDWPAGSKRPVYASAVANGDLPQYEAYTSKRIADKDRAPGYANPGMPRSKAIGYIPQVAHTYAYIDGSYGIMNEKGLMFGECTDGSFVTNDPEPGKRIFYSSELSRVALERCTTARDAIKLMGDLIEKYGYYGTGETLPVADSKEAWVMEMAPSATGTSGIWVAQRVPDGEVFVAANEFRIRDITPGNPDQMYSKNLFEEIDKAGWRSPKDKSSKSIDWLTSTSKGEYSHPYYSLRRVWRTLSLVAPSLNLPSKVENGTTRAYPFSVKPDKKLTLNDIKSIYRDHYEGTSFDLTKGISAGPFGSPERYYGPKDPWGDVADPSTTYEGAWERPIGMYYTGYTTLCQVKPNLPSPINGTLWIGLERAASTAFLPLAIAPVPASYENVDTRHFDWNSAWWNYSLVSNYANIRYDRMIKDIQARAAGHEANAEKLVNSLQTSLTPMAAADPKKAMSEYSKKLNAFDENVRMDWQKLFQELVVKYNQGMLTTPEKTAATIGYPDTWLNHTDYKQGPTKY